MSLCVSAQCFVSLTRALRLPRVCRAPTKAPTTTAPTTKAPTTKAPTTQCMDDNSHIKTTYGAQGVNTCADVASQGLCTSAAHKTVATQRCPVTCKLGCGNSTKAPTTTTTTKAPTKSPVANIILLGDSWAEKSGTSLANFCKGAKVTNKGVSSSTAQEWATGSKCPVDGQGSCNSSVVMGSGSFTHAVLSVGGNDFLDSSCSIQPSELQRRLEAAIGAVKAAGPAGMKVVLAGYCAGTIAMVRLEQRNTRDSSTWTVSHTSSTHMDMHIA